VSGGIFDVQRFSTHDGPGIRTVLFFKGCPLRCAWCENPESQSFAADLLHNPSRCVGCGTCLAPAEGGAMCRTEEGRIEVDRRSAAAREPRPRLVGLCPSLALRIAGRWVETPEILAELRKDEAFFRGSGGGVTLSGGEPLAQGEFALELTRALKDRGIDVAVESCLAAARPVVEAMAALSLLWLVDLKHVDPAVFRAGTGAALEPILANIEYLAASGADLALRVPVIPGFNADKASLRAILEYAAALPLRGRPEAAPDGSGIAQRASAAGARGRRLDLLPYHELAAGKYAQLGRPYPYPRGLAVDEALLRDAAERGAALGLEITIGG